MGICYLLNPVHKQVNAFFHNISHAIEIPNYVMSHDSSLDSEHQSEGHTSHQVVQNSHNHEIVDFINSIFEASNQDNDSEDSILTEIKIDKHLTTYQIQLKECFSFKILQKNWLPSKKLTLVYLNQLKEPPQFSAYQSFQF